MNAVLLGLRWKHSDGGAVIILFIFATFSPHEPPAILTDLCANRWHLYGKSWDVLLYGMVNALAQTTGGSSSLFSSTSPSLFLFWHLSDFSFPDTITHYDSNLSIHYFYFQTTVIFGIFFRTTSFYDHVLKLIFQLAEIKSPLPFLSISFLICLRKSLN